MEDYANEYGDSDDAATTNNIFALGEDDDDDDDYDEEDDDESNLYLTSTPLHKKDGKNLGSKTVSKNDLLSGSNIEGNSKNKYRIQNVKNKRTKKGKERNQKEEMNFYA